jgi:NTE family protein
VGTSAGAVAAAVLASEAFRWQRAVAALERVWANFRVDQVFYADTRKMMRAGLHWAASLMSGGMLLPPPRALFDNTPLRELLEERINWRHLQTSLDGGCLRALAICASSYTSASSVASSSVLQSRKTGAASSGSVSTVLQLDHVMASRACCSVSAGAAWRRILRRWRPAATGR